jgi:DNA-binding CsgD family transcriptional regulator
MADKVIEEPGKGGRQSEPLPFILFRRKHNMKKGELSYTDEALRILTAVLLPSRNRSDHLSKISVFCSRWANLLEHRMAGHESGESLNRETGFIEVILSGRRRYGVRGIVLSGQSVKQNQYLFILERTSLESAHLEILFRHYHLSNREKEIVRLLLAGNSNKLIAHSLGLTLNTVKGYMKLLTRKLGVSGRSEIVAAFIEKN